MIHNSATSFSHSLIERLGITMYEKTDCFDPSNSHSLIERTTDESPPLLPPPTVTAGSTINSHEHKEEDNVNLIISMEQHPSAVEMELLEKQLQMEMEHSENLNNNHDFVMFQQQQHHHESNQLDVAFDDRSNWDEIQMQNVHLQNHHMFHPTADLLNRFLLPPSSASSLLQNSSLSFAETETDPTINQFQTQQTFNFQNSFRFLRNNPATDNGSSVGYDPLYHLNLPPQPPIFRDLFQSNGYTYNQQPGSIIGGSLFGLDDREASGGVVYQDGDNRVLEFSAGAIGGRKGRGRNGKTTNHLSTERLRRDHFNTQYQALKNLVPSPTKNDRASIVGDAIDYINELMRTVNELKLLADNKRCSKERRKRHKTEEYGDENSNIKPNASDSTDHHCNGTLRSSWLQRKSKGTEVDVRILNDDVTIKLVHRKKINCLLLVSKFLDEFHLDLQHAAGGHIGDFYSFLFNTKIYEGWSVYASAIANKLIEVMDGQICSHPT